MFYVSSICLRNLEVKVIWKHANRSWWSQLDKQSFTLCCTIVEAATSGQWYGLFLPLCNTLLFTSLFFWLFTVLMNAMAVKMNMKNSVNYPGASGLQCSTPCLRTPYRSRILHPFPSLESDPWRNGAAPMRRRNGYVSSLSAGQWLAQGNWQSKWKNLHAKNFNWPIKMVERGFFYFLRRENVTFCLNGLENALSSKTQSSVMSSCSLWCFLALRRA